MENQDVLETAGQSELQAATYPPSLAVPLKRAFKAAISTVFSFETLFVLYLFAGRYKADPRLNWVPVDLTALFFVLSIVAGIGVLWRRGFKVRHRAFVLVLLALSFVVYVLASLAWTPGQAYAKQKALYISTLALWPLVACAVIIAQDQRRLRRFLALVALFSCWMALEGARVYLSTSGRRLSTLWGGNYMGAGRVLGLGALVLLAYRLFFARGHAQKIGAIALFLFLGYVLLILGGRGPFLATLVGAAVPLFLGLRVSLPSRVVVRRFVFPLLWLMLASLAIIAYLLVSGKALATLARLSLLVTSPFSGGSGIRLDRFAAAIGLWSQSPLFGHGIGSFSVLAGFGDMRAYPHNLILEILAELGLVGLGLFLAMLVYALRGLGPLAVLRRDPWRILVLMFFANVFLNAMVAGDIPDNRIVFGVLGLMTLPKPGGSC